MTDVGGRGDAWEYRRLMATADGSRRRRAAAAAAAAAAGGGDYFMRVGGGVKRRASNTVSFPRIPTQSCRSSARSLSASKSQDLRADRERAERKKQKKQSYDCCDTQQLEGETHDKSERVTSISTVTKLVPVRAYRERTESKSRRNASLITSCCVSMQFSEPYFGGQDSKTAHPKVAY